jgi:PTS system N-acetylgalactosamine-specific IID component
MEFFNTHPFLVNFVMGIVLSMEQNKSEIPSIRAVRVAAMGPLGGIGDALFWFTLVPITAGITANMAIQGNIAAPFIFLIIFNVAQFAVRYILMNWSYKLGIDAIGMLTARAKEFTRAASILGVFVVGVLTCVYGGTSINVIINNGTTFEGKPVTKIVSQADLSQYQSDLYDDTGALKADSVVNDLGSSGLAEITYTEYTETPVTIDIQKILNDIMPKIIPLFLTLMIYLLLSKFKWTPIKAISLILVLALVGSGFGLWPTIWP